jgi:hypothetical protein
LAHRLRIFYFYAHNLWTLARLRFRVCAAKDLTAA